MRKDHAVWIAAVCSLGLAAIPAIGQNAGGTTGGNGATNGAGGNYGATQNAGGGNGSNTAGGSYGANGSSNGNGANGTGGSYGANGGGNANGANGTGGTYGADVGASGNGANGAGGGYSANGGGNGANGNGGATTSGSRESAEASAGVGPMGAPAATVPQYTIADAYIFSGSALNTAKVMSKEGRINVEAPQLLRQQAEYLVRCISRATQDVAAVDGNAIKTNPNAVPAVRNTQGQLQAAMGDANQFRQALAAGGIGPSYQVTLQGVIGHLQGATQNLTRVAGSYPGSANIRSANASGGHAGGAKQR